MLVVSLPKQIAFPRFPFASVAIACVAFNKSKVLHIKRIGEFFLHFKILGRRVCVQKGCECNKRLLHGRGARSSDECTVVLVCAADTAGWLHAAGPEPPHRSRSSRPRFKRNASRVKRERRRGRERVRRRGRVC